MPGGTSGLLLAWGKVYLWINCRKRGSINRAIGIDGEGLEELAVLSPDGVLSWEVKNVS